MPRKLPITQDPDQLTRFLDRHYACSMARDYFKGLGLTAALDELRRPNPPYGLPRWGRVGWFVWLVRNLGLSPNCRCPERWTMSRGRVHQRGCRLHAYHRAKTWAELSAVISDDAIKRAFRRQARKHGHERARPPGTRLSGLAAPHGRLLGSPPVGCRQGSAHRTPRPDAPTVSSSARSEPGRNLPQKTTWN